MNCYDDLLDPSFPSSPERSNFTPFRDEIVMAQGDSKDRDTINHLEVLNALLRTSQPAIIAGFQ